VQVGVGMRLVIQYTAESDKCAVAECGGGFNVRETVM
jgi:hypothetical protein